MAKRIRLNKEQKKILRHLEWFVKNKINWAGEQNLKDAVLDGCYAVFGIRGDPNQIYSKYWTTDCYNLLIMADNITEAEYVVKWNTFTQALIVDLRYLDIIGKVEKSWKPQFNLPGNLPGK